MIDKLTEINRWFFKGRRNGSDLTEVQRRTIRAFVAEVNKRAGNDLIDDENLECPTVSSLREACKELGI